MLGTSSVMIPRSRKFIISVSEKMNTAYQAMRGLGQGRPEAGASGAI